MGNRLYSKFHHAIRLGHVHTVKQFVLNDGLSFNYMFPDGSFPLHIAAELGDEVLVKLMLSLKASPDLKNRHGQTALMNGIVHKKVVEALVNANAKVNLADDQRRTALHLCASHINADSVAIMNTLISAGARVNQVDKWGRTPLHVVLLNTSSISDDENRSTVVQMLKLLLRSKANVNACDHHKHTPLFLAVNSNNETMVSMLLNHGAHPDRVSRHCITPLFLAVMKGYTAICNILIQYNVDVYAYSYTTGKTSFRMAAEKGYIDICKSLWEAGYDVSDEYGDRPTTISVSALKCKAVSDWLISVISKPFSLKHLCRIRIRGCFGYNIQERVKRLKFPTLLKDYILLRHLIND